MPIYEYKRPDGTTFEIVQSFSDDPLTHDPDTGAPVERVLHAPAVHFKGSGFYNTDYGTRKRQRETDASSSEGTAGKDGTADGVSKSQNGGGKGPDQASSGDGKPASEKGSGASKGSKSPDAPAVAANG